MPFEGDIHQRTYKFALRIVLLARHIPDSPDCRVLTRQLVRSGTSVGANVEEAAAGSSRKDFLYGMNIALKDARETHYWLRLIRDARILPPARLEKIIVEADELWRILGAIVSKGRGTRRQ
jgi:four helix bundle protein